MKNSIKIEKTVKDNKRIVYWDNIPSFNVDEEELRGILREAETGQWQTRATHGVSIGRKIYEMLNRNSGQLQSTLQLSYDRNEPLLLYFDLPLELNSIPFELLHNSEFLTISHNVHIIRKVTDRGCSRKDTPSNRPLKILFTACSPIEFETDAVLNYEQEEEIILEKTERFPVNMTIEDSGSVQGIADSLYEAAGVDIIHVTGHAGIDKNLGPIFCMENDTGYLDNITPDNLYENIKNFPPKILFLSGCSTGKTDSVKGTGSFAYQMVEKGIPVVMGWGLPVFDSTATVFASELYRYLAMGKSVIEAVKETRKKMKDKYHTWPLLRIYTDGAEPIALITAGQKLRTRIVRKATYKYLMDTQVKVLEKGFVGRRRQIQAGVKVLKGNSDKYGMLITGTAGLGKSCLAGKLIERFTEKELIVIHGKLTKTDLFIKLREMFDRKDLNSGIAILNAEAEDQEKIRALFRQTFMEVPTLLYFDDFEQNLVRSGDKWYVDSESMEIIKPILVAIEWSKGHTGLMITSRYPFILEHQGKNLPEEKLHTIPLMGFRGADLEKKKERLDYIPRSIHAAMYMDFGKGNPRLLEWLDEIAKEEKRYDLESLKKELEDKDEEFRQKYIAGILADTHGPDFKRFLHKAAVYRQPVNAGAFITFGEKEMLDKGVTLTLMEKEEVGEGPVYWVNPVIRESMWNNLTREEQKETHRVAYKWYDTIIDEAQKRNYRNLEEAVYHALGNENIRGACKHAVPLGNYLKKMLLYRESAQSMEAIAEKISQAVIKETIENKDDNVPRLLNNLGLAWADLGDNKKAIEYYSGALKIDLAVFGDKHPNVAINYNNLGSAWAALGDNKKAIEYFSKAFEIFLEVFGHDHPSTTTVKRNIDSLKFV